MGDNNLPSRLRRVSGAWKDKTKRGLMVFQKKIRPGSPNGSRTEASNEHEKLASNHPSPHEEGRTLAASKEAGNLDAVAGPVRIVATNDSATTLDNIQRRKRALTIDVSMRDATTGSVPGNESTKDVARMMAKTQQENDLSNAQASRSSMHSRYAHIWNEQLEAWKIEHPKAYHASTTAAEDALDEPSKAIGALSGILGKEQTTNKIRARIRKYQGSFASARGIAMGLAQLDPFKIAPIICASLFFGIDFALNNMHEDDQSVTLDILLGCDDMATEYVSFERFFTRGNLPAIKDDFKIAEKELASQYRAILNLVSDIYDSCIHETNDQATSLERAVDSVSQRAQTLRARLTQIVSQWYATYTDIKRQHSKWLKSRKHLESRLSEIKETKEVRDWIKKKDDPEPELDAIWARVTTKGEYEDAGNWFLEQPDYCNWLDGIFQRDREAESAKRILWLNGTSGTGKTTIMYQAHSALEKDIRTRLGNGIIQVIPYFCYASTTAPAPDYETILRALLWHLSLLPDTTLDPEAREEYDRAQSRKNTDLHISSWERLFLNIIRSWSGDQFVFVVDALDECSTKTESDEFLRFMAGVMASCEHVHLLVSSQKHVVPIREIFDIYGILGIYKVDVNSDTARNEMERFIDGELERRNNLTPGSVFYNDKRPAGEGNLLTRLRSSLLKNSQGMFRWVQIWLDICLPTTTAYLIESKSTAEKYLAALKKDGTSDADPYEILKKAYQRLWDYNRPPHADAQKARDFLFHFVLGRFENSNFYLIKEAVGIGETTFNPHISNDRVLQLCSGFMYTPDVIELELTDLHWVHESARVFVSTMEAEEPGKGVEAKRSPGYKFSEQNNHAIFADLYINVVGNSSHEFWADLWQRYMSQEAQHFMPDQWKHYSNNLNVHNAVKSFRSSYEHGSGGLTRYLHLYGLLHCHMAAEKSSLYDPLWKNVLEKVLISSESALGALLLLESPCELDYPFLKAESGELSIHFLGAVISLHIIHREDNLQLLSSAADQNILQEIQHSAKKPAWLIDRIVDGTKFAEKLLPSEPSPEPVKVSALRLAIMKGNQAAVDLILELRRLGHNSSDNHRRQVSYSEMDSKALRTAVEHREHKIVELLLEKSQADVCWYFASKKDTRSRSPHFHKPRLQDTVLALAMNLTDGERLVKLITDRIQIDPEATAFYRRLMKIATRERAIKTGSVEAVAELQYEYVLRRYGLQLTTNDSEASDDSDDSE